MMFAAHLRIVSHRKGCCSSEFPDALAVPDMSGVNQFCPDAKEMSVQIISLDLALANGTMLTITPHSQPHLWKAAQVSPLHLPRSALTTIVSGNPPPTCCRGQCLQS